ncbi:MAG: RNA 2',3'-cyclic phosphodiesterase [Chloroflexi bacterium]|nr:RNA 2',3'-cyclic phosphodiesterase [Chloroflexota bacterium]
MIDPAPAHADTLRLFVSIALPDAWREALRRIQTRERHLAGIALRWVDPALFHLTIVFLGSQTRASLPQIESALRSAAAVVPPLPIRLGALGSFGPLRAPRVIWCAVEAPPGRLDALRHEIDARLDRIPISFDTKPLVPHITLARSRPGVAFPPPPLAPPPPPLADRVDAIVLMESRLLPKGPSYTALRSFPLGAA